MSADFFAELAPHQSAQGTFKEGQFKSAPDDWALVVTDIVDSTRHIQNGRHKAVNFVAAMAIAAIKNLCSPNLVPFLFGGDGAVVMVPGKHVEAARLVLARVRRLAQDDYQMQLRIGLVTVADLRRFNTGVSVMRYEPTPGNNFGLFAGGGVSVLEEAIKERGNAELTQLSAIDQMLDDGGEVDLTGLSCRWNELESKNGKMVTLIITGSRDFSGLYGQVQKIANAAGDAHPVKLDSLSTSWPPPNLMLEVRARRNGRSLARSVLSIGIETLIAWGIFLVGRPVGGFDPARYRQEMTANTDFCRFDDTLCFVIDCAEPQVSEIRNLLEQEQTTGSLQFGMHVSATALMTCLVTSPTDNLHVHFVDGGVGGYTEAAKSLKLRVSG